MIRIAAIGDVHVGLDDVGSIAPALANLRDDADVLLVAGDLTRHGDPAEARVLARELAAAPVPVLAVLGNHDHHMTSRRRSPTSSRPSVCVCSKVSSPSSTCRAGGSRCSARKGSVAASRGLRFRVRRTRDEGVHPSHAPSGGTDRVARNSGRCRPSRGAAPLRALQRDVRGRTARDLPVPGSYLLGEAIDRVGPTSRSMDTPTTAPSTARRPGEYPCATSRARSWASRTAATELSSPREAVGAPA